MVFTTVVLLAVAGAFCCRHASKARATYTNQLTKVFSVLEAEPEGRRVWGYSRYGNHWIFALFGGRFQHIPVKVDQNGQVNEEPGWEMDLMGQPPPAPTVTAVEFVHNLRHAGLTHVLTYDPLENGRNLPLQFNLLAESGEAEQIASERGFVLWRIGHARPELKTP